MLGKVVLDRDLGKVLDIKLGSTLGTILDRGLVTVLTELNIRLGSILGTAVLDIIL